MRPRLHNTPIPATTQPQTEPATGPATDATTQPVDEATTQPADGAPTEGLLVGDPIDQAKGVFEAMLDADAWAIIGQRFLLIGVLVVATVLVLALGRRLLLKLQRARNLPDTAMLPIRRTLRALIILLAIIVGLQFAGFSMATIWAALGTGLALLGVAFIAVWSVLSNIACSLMLMIFKPFRIGDEVEIVDNAAGPNVGGRVIDVTLMYVVLREDTPDGPALVQIPNNLFFQKTVRRRAGRRAVPIEQHVEKHGLTGREQKPPPA